MIEDLAEGRTLPGEGRGTGQPGLLALEVSEQGKRPLARSKTCRRQLDSAILGVDRRVQVEMGIRWLPRLGGHWTRSIWIHA
jgi:hypothetical protein